MKTSSIRSCLANSHQSYWSFPTKLPNPYLTDHNSFCHVYSITISWIIQIVKQTLFNCLSCLIVFVWYVYVMLFCVIVCVKNYVLSWEKWKDRILQKGKWHTYLLPILLCISVFSSMHDRWNVQTVYKVLDPSSE
jgi:hypothetical protein